MIHKVKLRQSLYDTLYSNKHLKNVPREGITSPVWNKLDVGFLRILGGGGGKAQALLHAELCPLKPMLRA